MLGSHANEHVYANGYQTLTSFYRETQNMFFFLKELIFSPVCVDLWLYEHKCRSRQRSEGSIRSPGDGGIGSCEPLDVCSESVGSSARAVSDLKH